jgi:hypothetical protein
MGRLDWKRGRWSAEVETQRIADGLRGYQPAFGDHVTYYRYDYERSQRHPVYDEAVSAGRIFSGPIDLPVLDVTHAMGEDELAEGGFYTVDAIQVNCSFRQIARTGLTHADLRNGSYLRDRLAYDGKLFRVLEMRILGQLQRSDVSVEINATQLKHDEIVNDPQFAQYAVDPNAAA